jgi:PQQ-dependent catabolism-associated CXXCW motif protein
MGFFHVVNQQSCVKTHCNLGLDASDSFLHAESPYCIAASVSFTLINAPLKATANARHIGKGCAMSIRIQMILLGALVAGAPLSAPAQDGFGTGARTGQQAAPPQARGSANMDQMAQMERQDLGVPPTRQLHVGAMHGPTPSSIPGGQVVTTKGLIGLVQGQQAPYILFDVLGQPEALPNAVPAAWLSQPGSFTDAVQRQATQMLAQQTQGRKDVALVFYCLSRECWMSYNAALRAINAGYTNVLWYRGGIEAWKMAGQLTQQGQMSQKGQTSQQGQSAQPGMAQQAGKAGNLPSKFVEVRPATRDSANTSRPTAELRIGQSQFFSFALPPGWRLGESGQYALTLLSPDNKAMTLMVGVAGSPVNYPAARFAFEKLSMLQPQNLQLSEARQARPAAGFRQAFEFDASFSLRGVPYRGVAKVSVAPAYDTATLAMTAGLSAADQWGGYATWLPQVADQVSALNGAAFGARGVMQQNLQNSVAYGEAAKQYRDWSQKNWQQVTDGRNASQDQKNFAVRENLGGVQTFANPYATQQSAPNVEMPITHKYYWTNAQGRYVGTNDPSADPNMGSTGDWRKMERVTR